MTTSETLLRMYEELANRYARQGEARMRDHCLVLAADAALKAEQPDQAERLRKRLLLTNPHHLLRPYSSMAEAMQSDDVRDYISDLRRKYPPEVIDRLLREVPSKSATFDLGTASPAPARTTTEMELPRASVPLAEPVAPEPLTLDNDDAPVSPLGYGLAVALFLVSLGAMAAGLVLALGAPWME